MRTTTSQPFFLRLMLTALVAFSCNLKNLNPCKDVDCGAHGFCGQGMGGCICEAGWELDANGQCNVQDLCFLKDCVNGTCNPQTGLCECLPGWSVSSFGDCTVQDLCFQVDCGDHGDCNPSSGACECDPGYALDADSQCNYELRGRFIGTWTGNHTDDFGSPSPVYTMTITRDATDETKVRFTAFMNFSCTATSQPIEAIGVISGDLEVIDEFQVLCSEYEADGIFDAATLLSENDLRIRAYITSGFSTWNLTGVYVRQ